MSATDLLFYAQNLPPQGPALHAGLALAARLDARLDALYVADLPATAFSLPEAVPVQLEETRRRSSEAEGHAPYWQALLDKHGLKGAWRVAQGDSVQTICRAAAGYDLLVMERRQQRSDAPVGFGTVSRCVFGSSRPVLVVPDSATVQDLGVRVLLAWNGSREATLALAAALPILQRADEVLLLDGSEATPSEVSPLPPPGLEAWLARRGVRTRTRPLDAGPSHAAGPLLLEAAHEAGSDLIVMGAWGRSRLSEMVLGGTTRHLFMQSDLPMLVAN
jgi:nucleotide-binding universal stress UspA family protein